MSAPAHAHSGAACARKNLPARTLYYYFLRFLARDESPVIHRTERDVNELRRQLNMY
jgi:hypothetical protein